MRLRFLTVPAAALAVACLAACGGSNSSPANSASPEPGSAAPTSAAPTSAAPSGSVTISGGGAGGAASTAPDAHGADMVDGGEMGAIEPNMSSQQVLTERFTDAKIKDAAKIAAIVKKAGPFKASDYQAKITAALKKADYSKETIDLVLKQLAM